MEDQCLAYLKKRWSFNKKKFEGEYRQLICIAESMDYEFWEKLNKEKKIGRKHREFDDSEITLFKNGNFDQLSKEFINFLDSLSFQYLNVHNIFQFIKFRFPISCFSPENSEESFDSEEELSVSDDLMETTCEPGCAYKMDLEDGYSPPPLGYNASIREEENKYWLRWLDLDTQYNLIAEDGFMDLSLLNKMMDRILNSWDFYSGDEWYTFVESSVGFLHVEYKMEMHYYAFD